MRTLALLLCLALPGACEAAQNKSAPITPCTGQVEVPVTKECAAAAVAESKFLEFTKHKVVQYSIYPFEHSSDSWYFIIQGWVGKPKQPLPGYNWLVSVDRAT